MLEPRIEKAPECANTPRPSHTIRTLESDRMTETQSTRIPWTCAACSPSQTEPGTSTSTSTASAKSRTPTQSGWQAVNIAELLALPRRAPWLAHHRMCDPNPGHESYWFDVARARTHAQLLNWSAHLMGKRWIRHTTWANLIERAAGVDA